MQLPSQLQNLSMRAQLSALGMVVLGVGLTVAVVGSQQQQEQRSRAHSSYETITLRSFTKATTGSGTLSLSKPSGTTASDVLIAHVVVRGASKTSITPPSGWQLVRRDNTTGSIGVAIYYKVAGSSEPSSYSFSFSSYDDASGGIAAYSGVDTASPIDASSGKYNSDSSTMTAPSVTTTTPSDMLLFFGAVTTSASVTPPSGMTEKWEAMNSGLTTSEMAQQLLTSSGSTGNKTGSHSASGNSNISQLVALRPASGMTPVTTDDPEPTTPPTSEETTITKIVTASSDDAEENTNNGAMDYDSDDLEMTNLDGVKQTVGIRFRDIGIPQGATVTNAYIEFVADESQSVTTNLSLYAQAIDNAPTFTSNNYNISSRAKTSVSTAWSGIPAWYSGSVYTSPNISSVIQEVINRPGWASGNALAIIITGTGHRTPKAYDTSTSKAPKLVITYSVTPPTPTPTVTPLPTTVPTAEPTPTNAPSATPVPTNVLEPTPTIVPGATSFNVTLLLHGIGKGGDSVNPLALGNLNPLRPQRTVSFEVYNAQNQLATTQDGTVTYDSVSGSFKGVIDMGTILTTGPYTVKVKSDQFLKNLFPGIQNITQGTTNVLPQIALINGDINGDNIVNLLDYNELMGCYSDLLPPTNCPAGSEITSDLNDDGAVNQFDYNLFLRELNNRGGQ